ncbi:YaaC family protein [Dactylosporangium sp. NPDC051484]|uniref:YaaC family protein n=1 Tax=Dactylosporangium sp. NPDC051484 TaxID=3154942 RepID=UPI00344D78E2
MQHSRPIQRYTIAPMIRTIVPHSEMHIKNVAWEPLITLARSPAASAKLFGPAGQANPLLIDEFSGYIRQAYDYFIGASHVPGTSGALLHYYCALQLAKAELLLSNSASILGVAIRHGLSHSVTNAADPALDYLTVKDGVFPLLYQRRIGSPIPIGTRIPIKDLLAYIPEIGSEASATLSISSTYLPLYHALLFSDPEVWSGIVALGHNINTSTISEFESLAATTYEEVQPPSEWKRIFGISYRALTPNVRMFQAKRSYPDQTTIDKVIGEQTAPFGPSLDNCIDDHADAFFWPKCNGILMTPSIARYVLMYYLSSVVRYKPSILTPARFPEYAWVFESFINSSALNIVTNSVDGITGQWHMYGVKFRW